MQSGIFLTTDVLASLSDQVRAEIEKALFGLPDEADDWDPNVVRLTDAQADDYLLTCGTKSRTILQMLVDSDGELAYESVMRRFKQTPAQLKSAWGGLTKRARTIVGKKSAKLIEWDDSDGEWIAYMHHKTVGSIRNALTKAGNVN